MADRAPRIALVGNPNTGKTTLFNALTGLRQQTGNYPGITVDIKSGFCSLGDTSCEIIDLPGTYSLAARSPDELIVLELLVGWHAAEKPPDVILSIVDATNLYRHLYLVNQLQDIGIPMVLAINMMDEADAQGIQIDTESLSKQLNIPCVPIQANKRRNLTELKSALAQVLIEKKTPVVTPTSDSFNLAAQQLRDSLPADTPTLLARRLLIDVNGHLEKSLQEQLGSDWFKSLQKLRSDLADEGELLPQSDVRRRQEAIRSIVDLAVVTPPAKTEKRRRDKIDYFLTHRIWGTVLFLVLMAGLFQAVFTGAEPFVDLIKSGQDWLSKQVSSMMAAGPLRSLLVDGIIKGVGGVLVFLPQIMILFACIGLLEDCGYLARAAFLMDKLMYWCGLNGRSFIPLLSSLGCAVPGIMSTRVIEQKKERLATILVAPLMSCSARLPLYALILGTFLSEPWWLPGLVLFAVYMLGFITAPLVALILKRTILRGNRSMFLMEMPPLRRPQLRNIIRRVWDAGLAFIVRAGTLIVAAMVLVWASLYFPAHDAAGNSYPVRYDALEAKLEGLPDDATEAQKEELTGQINALNAQWKADSYLGQVGHALEPAFRPLGWDWKIGVAALASFPAREVVVGTLGILYGEGDVDPGEIKDAEKPGETPLGQAMRKDFTANARDTYRVPIALSLVIFFAYCCQCVSTLAVIRRETKSWRWPVFTFVYMTGLAYLAALVTFQVGKILVDALA